MVLRCCTHTTLVLWCWRTTATLAQVGTVLGRCWWEGSNSHFPTGSKNADSTLKLLELQFADGGEVSLTEVVVAKWPSVLTPPTAAGDSEAPSTAPE